jgi:hypothetical protein
MHYIIECRSRPTLQSKWPEPPSRGAQPMMAATLCWRGDQRPSCVSSARAGPVGAAGPGRGCRFNRLQPRLQIPRRHRRSLLIRMEHADRPALENHVCRPTRLDNRGLFNVRIGISGRKATPSTQRASMNGSPDCHRLFRRIVYVESIGVGEMSEDKERLGQRAGEANTSDQWGDPPPWSPWNFQSPKPNREWQKKSTVLRTPVRKPEMK